MFFESIRPRFGQAFFFVGVLAALSGPGTAQTTSAGTIQGVVNDASGAPVPGARVTARNEGTQALRTAETDAGGQFTFSGLPIGRYSMRVEQAGFTPVAVEPFLLSVGQTVTQNFEVQPAGLTERVEVQERSEAIDTAATTSSVALGYDRIEEAPAPNRNYLNFVLLAPNVAPSSGSNAQSSTTAIRSPLSDSGFTFGGLRGRNNSITIDGVDNRDETTGGNRVAIGLEMVQEFRVAGVSVGAELGGAAGGLVNVVTRSGVNTWHGDATFFIQNETFNARKPEVQSAARPRFRRGQPGTSISGPVRKDRTYIAGAIEYERESSDEWSETPASAVPSLNRGLALPVFAAAGVRTAYRGLYDAGVRGIDASLKLNHQLGTADNLSLRYAFSRGRVLGDVQGPENFADRSAQGSSRTTDHSLAGNWLHLVSSTAVSDFRLQVAERGQEIRPNGGGAMLEIPGVVTLGQSWRMDASRTERHYQVIENFSFVAGPHRLSAGADVHAVTLDALFRNRFGGLYVFPTLEAFAQGRPDVFVQAFGDPRTALTAVPAGAWIQDRWQLRTGLHLELGMRYDRLRLPAVLPETTNNWSPRIGLAWRPAGQRPLVIRAGVGLFYDRIPLAYLNDAVQKNGSRAFEQYAAGEDAANAFAISRGGTLAAPLPGLSPAVYRVSAPLRSAYSRKISIGAEQAFGSDTTLTVEATHVRGFRLPRTRNVAGALPPTYELEQTARSDYLGGSVMLNRRMSRELGFLFAYTVGRTKDDGSDFDEQPMDPFNIRQDWARSRQHQLHRFAASALLELPVEELQGAPQWFREGFERISIAPVFTVGSGRPINTLLTTDLYRTGAYPISARPPGMRRNQFYAPAISTLDLRVMKTIPFMNERAKLVLGIESFNMLNRRNALRVSQYYATPAGARLPSYGRTIEGLPGRQVQFLLNIEY